MRTEKARANALLPDAGRRPSFLAAQSSGGLALDDKSAIEPASLENAVRELKRAAGMISG